MRKLHLTICKDCGDNDIEKARTTLKTARISDEVDIQLSECLGPCDRPTVMALQSAGGAGYVFAGLDLEGDAEDIVATCKHYLESCQGWIDDARPCGRLRHLLVARMPV